MDNLDKTKLTFDTSSLKEQLEKRLNKEGYDNTSLTKYNVFKEVNPETKESYYFLVATNDDNTISTATEVFKKGDKIYLLSIDATDTNKLYMSAGTITCSGCSYACNPKKGTDEDGSTVYYCTAGCAFNNCTKTVTQEF